MTEDRACVQPPVLSSPTLWGPCGGTSAHRAHGWTAQTKDPEGDGEWGGEVGGQRVAGGRRKAGMEGRSRERAQSPTHPHR